MKIFHVIINIFVEREVYGLFFTDVIGREAICNRLLKEIGRNTGEEIARPWGYHVYRACLREAVVREFLNGEMEPNIATW